MHIALKETAETEYWIKLLFMSEYIDNKMKEGFYYFIQFESASDVPANLEASVRIMENVIRYLCVKQEA